MSTKTLNHPDIGRIAGVDQDDTIQFRGVKYATLKDRFSPADLVQYDGKGLNATKHGPQVISPPNGLDMEFSFIQHALPKPEFPGMSDVDGLNLVITVPNAGAGETKHERLPVLVFIHGGGYAIGGNWWPQYDFSSLVRQAAQLGRPIVGVNINYRLGAPGFLTSPELRAAGCRPNNGLSDQRTALRWVQKYIGGFGGDPNNVTVMGESAGGVSAGYLLLSEEALAKRIICLGGCPPLLGQLPLPVADTVAESVKKHLNIEGLSEENFVKTLNDLPAENFWSKIPPNVPFTPVVDGEIIPEVLSLETWAQSPTLPGNKSIEAILVGDSKLDSSIMGYMLMPRKSGLGAAFRDVASKTLEMHPEALNAVLEHYSLTEAAEKTLTEDQVFRNVLQYISDVAFFAPAIELATGFRNTSYVYAFNEPNPWDGLFKGEASHILDVVFIFQNYNEYLSETQRVSAVSFGQDVIMFANGEAPWKSFSPGQHGTAVYEGGTRTFAEPPEIAATKRDAFLFELTRSSGGVTTEKLLQVFNSLMM
ncbi:hypothetical protein PFICI_07595 [Pestalotiopsis fici W106-1]|uniref:Carboxylic ester hydrolase n=1 Tax=Pestalotiopsis fici (strain W106-1 / CGMCC3.15140) TaxID=1229662 RepID=W3X4G3_PESFW|nr:uncharacterized protein PFICI_07595 [Pestalotiopsis fici W106-1]ETS80066.1 hypothetical protein PFICI_07595 [Pestalotiopsis fici W106-1]